MKTTLTLTVLVVSLALCGKQAAATTSPAIPQETYGKMPDGREVRIFTLTNKNGLMERARRKGRSIPRNKPAPRGGKNAAAINPINEMIMMGNIP